MNSSDGTPPNRDGRNHGGGRGGVLNRGGPLHDCRRNSAGIYLCVQGTKKKVPRLVESMFVDSNGE